MVYGTAVGTRGARRVVDARVQTLVLNACLVSRAIGVDLAFDSFATCVGVSGHAPWTLARCQMVLGYAFSVHGTRVGDQAGIDTLVVVACLCRRTIPVRRAFQFLAFNFRVSAVSWRAIAQRFVVDDDAFGIGSAVARADALRVVASILQIAVVVVTTTHQNRSRWIAASLRISQIAFGTFANGSVALNATESIFGTRVSYGTWIDAMIIDAAIVLWALLVSCAADSHWRDDRRADQVACVVRVSGVSIGASASGSVVVSRAKCVDTTGLDATCVDAVA